MKYQQLPSDDAASRRRCSTSTDADFSRGDVQPKARGARPGRVPSGGSSRCCASTSPRTPTLQRIKAGKRVREEELEELARLVLQIDDKADVNDLADHDPETRRSLSTVFRGLIGPRRRGRRAGLHRLRAQAPAAVAQQIRFLHLLQNHIAQYGGIELERLYEPPFTTLHAESSTASSPTPRDVDDSSPSSNAFEPKRHGEAIMSTS